MPITRNFESFDAAVDAVCASFADLKFALRNAIDMDIAQHEAELPQILSADQHKEAMGELVKMTPPQFLERGIRTWSFDEEGEPILNERSQWFGPVSSRTEKVWWWEAWGLVAKIRAVHSGFTASIFSQVPALLSKEMADAWENGWNMHSHMPSDDQMVTALYWISKILKKRNSFPTEIPF